MFVQYFRNLITQHLACTLAPKIRTNAISPGFIIPEENTIVSDEYISNKMKQIPLKTQGSVEEIIHAVEYLLNSKYINGPNIYVDGGTHLLTL
jgi:3-oxoacyl-[acyl-carrier protein] reductase